MTTVVQPSVAAQSEAEALHRFQTEAPHTVRAARVASLDGAGQRVAQAAP
ncbi:hypothetical protein ACFWOB_00440 [Streptomyces sp. NPDC058420]|jgi:hypothetical protein